MSVKLIICKPSKKDLLSDTTIIPKSLIDVNNIDHPINCKIIESIKFSFKERDEIYQYLDSFSEKIIYELKDQFNFIHKVNFDYKEWKIILSPWLNNFLRIIYQRYFNISKILNDNKIEEIEVFNCEDKDFVPIDNLELNHAVNDLNWNAIIYSKIIKFINKDAKLTSTDITFNLFNIKKKKKLSKLIIIDLARFFLKIFTKKNDALIVNSYLPFLENLKLNLSLKQLPHIWKFVRLENRNFDAQLRKKIIFSNTKDNFEKFVKKLIPNSIPQCHLESFGELKKIIFNLSLPDKPKLIFTSNSYEYDEVFKLYTAIKTSIDCPYIIGQHGSYLSWIENKFFKKSHEANFYLDWGKKGFYNQDGFNLKLVNINIKNNKNGKILILDSPFGTENKIFNRLEQNETKEIFLHSLLNSLDKNLQKLLVLRLHTSFKQRDKFYLYRIKSICPGIQIETDEKTIFKSFSNSRCVIHTYDSSGIYESMGLNIPTLCMWPDKFNHIQEKYHYLYNELKKNNILFFEPENLAEVINNQYDNLDQWWRRKNIVRAKNIFLQEFSNFPKKNSINIIKRKLIELKKLHNNKYNDLNF